MVEDKIGMSRRSCLRNLGVSALSMGMASSTATADSSGSVERVGGPDGEKIIAKAQRTDGYNTLRQTLRKEDYSVQVEDRDAFRVEPSEGKAFTAVGFSFSSDVEDLSIEIGVPLSDSAPIPAKAIVTKHDGDKFPLRVTHYVMDKGDYTISSSELRSDLFKKETQKIGVGEQSVMKRTDDLTAFRHEMKRSGTVDDGVNTPAYVDCEKSIDEMPCWACKDAASVVNVMGCGTYTWVICGAASFPTGGMGGLACGTIVGVICWAIMHYGVSNPTELCKKVCAC